MGLGKLIGQKPSEVSVAYHHLPGGARRVITNKTSSSNWFVTPEKSVHQIHLDRKGGRKAREYHDVVQRRQLTTAGNAVVVGGGVSGAAAGTGLALNRHKKQQRVKKSMNVSAFGVDHGYR
jgi:hypothetical protein